MTDTRLDDFLVTMTPEYENAVGQLAEMSPREVIPPRVSWCVRALITQNVRHLAAAGIERFILWEDERNDNLRGNTIYQTDLPQLLFGDNCAVEDAYRAEVVICSTADRIFLQWVLTLEVNRQSRQQPQERARDPRIRSN